MFELWESMGHIRWPLLFSFLAVVGLTAWSVRGVLGAGASPDRRLRAWIDAILFWGGFAFITGVLGTLIGVMVAAAAIEAAGGAEPGLVWGGIRVAMSSTAVGALILALASLAWFPLQLRWRLLASRSEGHAAA